MENFPVQRSIGDSKSWILPLNNFESWIPQLSFTNTIIKEKQMSKVAELSTEIQGMLQEGYLPVTIARELDVPITWIFEEIEQDELSPFTTINS